MTTLYKNGKVPPTIVCNFKMNFEFENYLTNVRDETLRKTLTRFKLASYKLAIETGRDQNIDRQNRLCSLCNDNRIESEYHFLCICPKYCELRSHYLTHFQTSSGFYVSVVHVF